MSEKDQEEAKFVGPDDEYGQNLSPEEGSDSIDEQPDLKPFFEGESIIPGMFHKVNESCVGDDNILHLLEDPVLANQKKARNNSSLKKKGQSKDRTRKKHSLSKNRQNGKDSYVMLNTFENLSNRMLAKSTLTGLSTIQGSVRDTSNILGSRKQGISHDPVTLKNLDAIAKTTENTHLDKKESPAEATTDGPYHSKIGNGNHLNLDRNFHKDQLSQKKYGNKPIFANILIEKRDSPVAPSNGRDLPMQMKTEVIRLRKNSDIDRDIIENGHSRRMIAVHDKGPIRILKNVEQLPEDLPRYNEKINTLGPSRNAVKSRRSAAISKDISINEEGNLSKEPSKRRVSNYSKSSMDKKGPVQVHHFKTIKEVLLQNSSNQAV